MKTCEHLLTIMVYSACFLLFAGSVYADTIMTTDGQEMKGIIVEDYRDRVVFSTVDGEVTVMKSGIRELLFDSEEENLIKLAELASERRDYSRAMGYYDMALKINPSSGSAKQGMAFIRGSMFRKEESLKAADIKRQQDLELYGPQGALVQARDDIGDMAGKLERSTGMKIEIFDSAPRVAAVKPDSRSFEAGLRKGDILISVWSRLTGYMSLNEILDLIINRSAIEIRCVFERVISVAINPGRTVISGPEGLIGATLVMDIDGLTVGSVKEAGSADNAGIQKGDLVVAIDGNKTRYMPLKRAVELMRNSKNGVVNLTIRRKAVIWRGNES